MKYHYKPIGLSKVKKTNHTNVSENVEQVELSYTAGENLKWYNHSRIQFGRFYKKKLNIHIPYNPDIP